MDLDGRSSPAAGSAPVRTGTECHSAPANVGDSVLGMLLQNYKAEGYEKAMGSPALTLRPLTRSLGIIYIRFFPLKKQKTFSDHHGP